MKPNAAQDVVSYVMDRLASGLYPPGCRLPTSRELATELGVHRNTVAKAYKSLADLGLVASAPGRGTFATSRIDSSNRQLYLQRVSERLEEDVLRARRSNIHEDDLRRMIDQHITAIYQAAPPRGAFVECNPDDLRVAVSEIEQQSDVRLAPILLDALAADLESAAANYDVVFTSLFHLLEVRELLANTALQQAIVGIHTQPDEQALAKIAQIAPNAHVGVVVSNRDGARRFSAQIQTFTSATVRTLIRPTDDAIRDLANEVDLIVTSRSRAGQIRRLNLAIPLIELSFHISRESTNRVIDAFYGLASSHGGSCRIDSKAVKMT